MSIKIVSVLLSGSLLISACSSLETMGLDPEYLSLRDKVEQSPGDTLLLGRLADMANMNFASSGNTVYRDEAIELYGRYLKANPGHLGAAFGRYGLLAHRYINEGRSEDIQAIRVAYQGLAPIKASVELSPPSLIQSLRGINAGESDFDEHRDLLQAALKENPRHVVTRLILAQVYKASNRPRLARAMVAEAARQQPTNPDVAREYADMLNEVVGESHCSYDRERHRTDLKAAIKAAKQALKANPKDADIVRDLSVLYEALGQSELALFEAKRFVELNPGSESQWFLVDQYTANGQFEDAFNLAEQLMVDKPAKAYDLENSAMAKFQQGDYESALTLFQEYRDVADPPSVYYVIREAIAAETLDKPALSKEALASLSLDSVGNDWEKALLRFHRRDLSEADLLDLPKDACEKTEGHYFIARRALLEGNKEKARYHFKQTVDLEVPRFYEYVSGKLLLQEL